MFKRKKQTAPPTRPPPLPPPPTQVQRRSVPKLSIGECLQQTQAALQRLRSLNPGDLQAFPLLNEIQRLVQQLKEATASLPPADREAWSFQIADLEDEFRELADVVVSRADAAPKPEPRLSSPSIASTSYGASGRSSTASALMSPSNSGRVQQAVALFSRQDGFTNGNSVSRIQTAHGQQRPVATQQQVPQQSYVEHQQPQQYAPPVPQLQPQQYYQQQQQQYPHAVEQPPSQAAGSAMSTPARSESSYMYLTEEERQLLAQKQQALLQKHIKYLAQQRGAHDEGTDQLNTVVPGQQVEPAGLQRQHAPAQHLYQHGAPHYHAQGPPPSEYSSTRATPFPGAEVTSRQPVWTASSVQAAASGYQTPTAAVHALSATAAPGGVMAARPTVAAVQSEGQGLAHPGTLQQTEDRHVDEGPGGDVDDLFSGLDVAVAEDQPSLPLSPEPAVGSGTPASEQADGQLQQQQHPEALGTVGRPAVPALSSSSQPHYAAQQRSHVHSFRPAGHSMPHQCYAGSQLGSRADGAGPSMQDVPPGVSSGLACQPAVAVGSGPAHPSQSQSQQQQEQGWPVQYPEHPVRTFFAREPVQQGEGQQQSHLHTGAQHQLQHQQQPQFLHKRQLSAQGYQHIRAAVGVGDSAAGVLASPSWRGNPSAAQTQVSPFYQATDGASAGSASAAASLVDSGPASSAHVSAPYQGAPAGVGYGGVDEASSRGPQSSAAAAPPTVLEPQSLVAGAGAAGVVGPNGHETQQETVSSAGYFQHGDVVARSATPVSLGHAGQCAASAHSQVAAPPDNPPQVSPYVMRYLQQQRQQQQQVAVQQHPADESPLPPPVPPSVDPRRYPQVQWQDAPQLPGQRALGQQQHYLIAQQSLQQSAAPQHPFSESARYPQVWPHESAQPVAQQQGAQQIHNAQQPVEVPCLHAASMPLETQQQAPLLEEPRPVLPPPQPAQHLSQAELYLQQARQYRQQQQQQQQQAAQAAGAGHNNTEVAVQPAHLQPERLRPAEPPVQEYLPALLQQTPEEQARTQMLQQIAESVPAASTGVRLGQPYVPGSGHVGSTLPAGTSAHASMVGGSRANAAETGGLARPSFEGNTSSRSGFSAARGAQYASVHGAEMVGGSPAAPAAALAAAVVQPVGGQAYPMAATIPSRPSPSISAFIQNAQNGADALTGSMTPPRQTVLAMSPYSSGAMPGGATATTSAATPMHAATATTQQPQPDAGASGRSPATQAASMPPSGGALRSRSRALVSGGGGTSSGGLMTDPAASLPALSSLPNVTDLESFLDNITGSVDACHTAAEQRARDMVAALGAALSQAQKVEASVQQQRRAVKAALAGVMASVAQLESDQAAAVEGEDFDTAAALDEQLAQLSSRQAILDDQVQLLANALQRTAALRLQVLGRQAEVWRITGAYLARLQSGQQQIATALASQAEREAQAAAMLHRAAQEALAQRRGALDERNAALDDATAEVSARVAAATAPAEAERQRRVDVRDALQADVESLRALLAAKEAELVEAEAAVEDAAEAVRQQAAAFDHDLARLEEERRQLVVEASQLAGHEQALQESERQAGARAAAVEEHQAQLKQQADALDAAGETMCCEAEALSQRVATEARNQEQRTQLQQADERAREELKGLERCISDLSTELSRLSEQRGRLTAERAAAQEGLARLQRAIPELEAAKRAAASNKDFREAARLSGELRSLSAQADVAAAQMARVSAAMSELAAAESGKVSELEELRAMIHEAQRHAAEAHHRYLVFSLSLSRAALEDAVGAELYEEAGALQAEVAAEEAEVMALERTWGFIRPAQAANAAAAAAARRRTSLEASTVAAAQLHAQYSRQSLGSLSAQSSRSLSSQLPQAAAQLAGIRGPVPLLSTGGGAPPSTGGAVGPYVGMASPTSIPVWQQPHSQHPYLHHPQQQPVFPTARRSGRTVSDNGDGAVGVTNGNGMGLATLPAAQLPISGAGPLAAPVSPPAYIPPTQQFSGSSAVGISPTSVRHTQGDAGSLQMPASGVAGATYGDGLEPTSMPPPAPVSEASAGQVRGHDSLDQPQSMTQAANSKPYQAAMALPLPQEGAPPVTAPVQQQEHSAVEVPYIAAGPPHAVLPGDVQRLPAESGSDQLQVGSPRPAGSNLMAAQAGVSLPVQPVEGTAAWTGGSVKGLSAGQVNELCASTPHMRGPDEDVAERATAPLQTTAADSTPDGYGALKREDQAPEPTPLQGHGAHESRGSVAVDPVLPQSEGVEISHGQLPDGGAGLPPSAQRGSDAEDGAT